MAPQQIPTLSSNQRYLLGRARRRSSNFFIFIQPVMEYRDACLMLALLVLLFSFLYKKFTQNLDFWEKQGVPFVEPQSVSSIFNTTIANKKPLHETEKECYDTYGRVYGRFEGPNPVLSVGDPDILRRIFVKDFHIFQNRRDMKFHDPIMDNTLFILEGEAWRRVRNIVTPTFTTSKLKRMLPLLGECCDVLINKLKESSKDSKSIDCQTHFEGFVLYAIGRCAFGMTINALKDPNNTFTEKSKKLFEECFSWRTLLTIFCPILMKIFRMKLLNPETTQFYRNIIVQVLEERKKLHVVKDDFLQMLLDAANDTNDSNNNGETVCPKGSCNVIPVSKPVPKAGLSHDEMLSQCITFFIAGFDPTTSLLSNAAYNIAMHLDCQDNLLEEVKTAMSNNNGTLSYEALSEMKLMDSVMNECLRMCPAMVRSERRCEEDYFIKERNIVLKKGMLVSIPVYAIHHDPEFYPEPEKFKAERFLNADPIRPQYVHLPFGAGPRICVGMRFVFMQAKLCLAKLLLQFELLPAPSTPATLDYIESRNILKAGNVEICLKERCS